MTEPNPDPPAAPTPPLDLFARYPACFDRANPRPLKRAIQRDLWRALNEWDDLLRLSPGTERQTARDRLRQALDRALFAWLTQPAYLQSLLKDAARIDLAGQPSGTVSAAEAKVARRLLAHPLDLIAASPAAFDPGQPRPLKIGIHRDLIAAGHPSLAVRLALQRYTALGQYRRTLVAGTPRVDLLGQPAGDVSEEDAANAQDRLSSAAPKPGPRAERPQQTTLALPQDAPLTPENIVTGRLELTVKFTELPKPLSVKAGMKIGIQTDTALVVATLPPKVWKKLEQAARDWPSWIASLTGKLGAQAGSDAGAVVVLEQAAVQVFERTAKPAA